MKTGIIQDLISGRGFGFINKGRERVFFHLSALDDDIKFEDLEIGMEVEYKDKPGDRGPRATIVRLKHAASNNEYRFLNPYNFVRFLNQSRPNNNVLGNCPPPPHDRYVGLTGRITCEVEAVTPLFVSDSHGVEDDKGHKTYRFFEYDGQPALPASSLRGMVRSVFEAVTNSCLGVFDKAHLKTLEYREEMGYAQKLKAGIVLSIPTEGQAGEIALCEAAKIGAYYEERKWKNRNLDISGFQCGEYVWARVTGRKHKIRVWQLTKKEEDIQYTTPRSRTVSGYLKITGNSIETKNNEFLFLDPDKYGNKKTVAFGKSVMAKYNQVLDGQLGDERIEKGWFQNRQLKKDDLVWVEVNEKTNDVIRIARVRVPRVPYQKSVNDLLSPKFKHLHHCKFYEELCPACRTFGWVADKKAEGQNAYAGRVRLTHAKRTHDAGTLEDTPLAILSSPKPTTTLFYLLNQDGKPADVDYNSHNAQLRGRKVYRHHGQQLRENEYKRDPNGEQNRTVRGALQAGAKFTFTLDFENLADVELGALLWALELEEGMHHRLGYAKPLGFGSVTVEVTKLEQLKPRERYQSLESWDTGWLDIFEQKDGLKKRFKESMLKLYGQFDQLSSVQDLHALLGEPTNLPIHYPRPNREPSSEENNYEWFMGNKERKEPLLLPPNDTKGYPIWDKKGNETT